MKNKGYTIMEAVIAMFLVVVMVGAVFSALMSSRRAMVASSEREEVYYAVESAYGAIKDCRSHATCALNSCAVHVSGSPDSIIGCNQFFTFNFDNLCRSTTSRAFTYDRTDTASTDNPQVYLSQTPGDAATVFTLPYFHVLDIETNCQEAL